MDKKEVAILRSDDRLGIKAIYNAHRDAFLNFGKRYSLDQDQLADIYQEAFLALRKHAISGRLDVVKSGLKTYLFGIGKYLIYDLLKKENKHTEYDSNLHSNTDDYEEIRISETPELTKEQLLLRTYFKELGKKCRQVLTFFYYRGLSIEEIVEQGGYENANTVKAQKSRCLKTLKQLIKG
ncbi:sigma-70 family RNA polymerase sigma factor [Spongiivirga sp. MCCC 1A20706]|uniref:RNA polymerase sigma factor n=1 Tax=Spongiivirga sp. MCCC 1A20706 TaxID=3160963 RepID=UPI0039775AD7